jgi:hypothetical protein
MPRTSLLLGPHALLDILFADICNYVLALQQETMFHVLIKQLKNLFFSMCSAAAPPPNFNH